MSDVAFSVYKWQDCAFTRYSLLLVEGSIDKMRNIYPLNPRFTLPFVFLLIVSLLFMLPGGLIFGQSPDDTIEYPENGTDQVAIFTATDPENAGAIVWSLSGDDVEHFDIDEADGVLSFKEAPDYEMSADDDGNNIYSVMVVATDADDMTTEKAVTIEVTNVDEDGKITLDKMAPYPGILLTATLADPDMMEAGSAEWQWSRSRSENGSYTDIEDADEAAYTPTSGDVDHYLRATVGYNDGEGDDKSAMMTSANEVQTFNVPNVAPIFPDQDPEDPGDQSEDATRMVVENTDAGEDIGDPVAAGDANDDILTYTLGDTPADNAFDIDPATGQIKTKADLDADENASYDVIVTATDPAGLDDTIMVAITVTDVNEPPDITGDVEPYAENGTGDVADFTATDPEDQGNVTLDLSGTDAALFELSNGTLTFEASPNYEMPGDADNNNVYEVTVGATDGDGIRATKDVEVKVTNVEEDGTVTFSAVQPRVGIPLTARVTDIDGAVSGVMWQWSKNGAAIDDATSNTYTPVAADSGDTLTATATYTDPEGSDMAAGAIDKSCGGGHQE